MTRKRVFIERVGPGARSVAVEGPEAHHLTRVLRAGPGDSIEVRDGSGNAWEGVIDDVRSGVAQVRLERELPQVGESWLDLTLALAFSRSDRMELALRQATEMGVVRFVAFRAHRSQYGLSGRQVEAKRTRWIKIAREALLQCGRMKAPEIVFLGGVAELIEETGRWAGKDGDCLKALASEGEREGSLLSLWERRPTWRSVVAAVGPEGGWTEEETRMFVRSGFHPVRLGPRVLRLETAAAAIVAMVQLLWGDFGNERGEGQ